MWKEFKKFIMTGNVIEFAVAVILAGAVSLVVKGFVDDIMMPIVGEFTGGLDFADLKYVLTPEQGTEGEPGYIPQNAIRYGNWINSLVNLVIVGFVLFVIVKGYNRMKSPPPPPAPTGPTEKDLLGEIRDLLKEDRK